MLQTIGKIIFSIGLGISSLFGFHQPEQKMSFGSFTPVQASQFTLAGSGINSTQNTITLTSFTLPDPNRTPITMSMFGAIGYAVLEPQSSKIENISFTGVTQNANGSATLTGVSRGISFYSPYTASSTLALSHSGGAYLILSNSAAFYGQFAFLNNDATITGVWDFSSYLPTSSILATTSNQFATKQYVDGVAIAGVATSTESNFGGVWLASQLQMASSTYNANSPTVLYSRYSTSSPTSSGLYIPITRNDGKLNPNFIATTSTDTYNFGGSVNLNNQTNIIASSTQYVINAGTINATSTITLSGNAVPQPATSTTYLATTTHTWTKPTNAKKIFVQLWGGGGSGAKGNINSAGGGGGGEYQERWYNASELSSSETVTVGAGGVAKSSAGDGNNGGNTSFGSHVTANGGSGGISAGTANAAGGNGGSSIGSNINGLWGAGGSASSGQSGIYSAGGAGTNYGSTLGNNGGNSIYGGGGGGGSVASGVGGAQGTGGSSQYGGSGSGGAYNTDASSGSVPAGGGGAVSGTGNSGAGGNGKAIITVFY